MRMGRAADASVAVPQGRLPTGQQTAGCGQLSTSLPVPVDAMAAQAEALPRLLFNAAATGGG